MLTIFWYVILVFGVTSSVVWVIENNGTIIINWLGYEIQSDILTASLIFIFFFVFIAFLSYVLTRILAIKFPQLLKLLFKKSYTAKLEKIIANHHRGFDTLTKILLALEVDDYESAKSIHKNFKHQIKYKSINDFFFAKFALENSNYDSSQKFFAEFKNNPHGKILLLKSQLKIAIKNHQDSKAIELGQEILSLKKNSIGTARELVKLYKKNGHWQLAKNLIKDFGTENFSDELQNRDFTILNTSLAQEAFKSKKYFQAIKYSKIALGLDDQFMPANEILIKSWLKLGLNFKAVSIIKNLWKETPNLILVEIFNIIYKKNLPKNRLKAVKKLVKLNSNAYYSNYAIGLVAFRSGLYKVAKEHFTTAFDLEKSQNLYRLIANCEKFLGNKEEFYKNITIAKMLPKTSNYICTNCQKTYSRWQASCDSCASFDSIQ